MAKKKKRRSSGMTIPMAPVLGVIAAPDVRMAVQRLAEGNLQGAMVHGAQIIGVHPAGNFDMALLGRNITPMIIGLLLHKFVGGAPLNFNRMLGRAKIPFIRI